MAAARPGRSSNAAFSRSDSVIGRLGAALLVATAGVSVVIGWIARGVRARRRGGRFLRQQGALISAHVSRQFNEVGHDLIESE